MSEARNILAGFKTVEDAKKAAIELKNRGYKDMQIDQVGLYPGNHLNDFTNPITGGFSILSDLTLGSFSDKDAEVLAAADVSASGMVDGHETEIDQNILLTVVTDEEHLQEAERIIKKYHGKY